MKKMYVCLFGILATGLVFGQKTTTSPMNGKKYQLLDEKSKTEIITESKGITIWSNDFSTASDWTTSNDPNGTPAHTSGDWAITTNLTAIPVAALTPAAFTSAANGYALINSDAAGAAGIQNAKIVTTASINLSTQPLVVINFQQSHRRYAESTYVVYSIDGGTTWNEIEVNAGMTVNTNTTNPATVQVNLSAQIGGQANVKIGFKYTGNYDWFWAVDNVKLMTPDDYDLGIAGAYWGSTGFWGARLPYYQIPSAQVTAIDFSGVIANLGALSQDATFGATVGTYVGSSAATTIVAGASDTLNCTAAFTPAATVASYTVNMAVTSPAVDAVPANNTIANAATIAVNQKIYARDNGTIASGSYNQGMGFEVGNIFDMFATADITAIDVTVASSAVAGAQVYAKLYSIDPTTGDFIYVDESNAYTLTTGDLGTNITFPLIMGAFTLNAGESYLVVAGSNGDGGLSNDLVVGTAGVSEAQTSYYLDQTNTTWYYTTSTPMVRMNFSAAGINENNANFGLNVYPNPAGNEANVSITAENASVAVVLTDVSGKVVYSNNLGTVNGMKNLNINTSNFANGIYMVNVTSNGTVTTQKLVVRN